MAIAIRGTTPAHTATTSDPVSLTLNGTRQPTTDDVLVIIHFNNFYTLANMATPTVGGSTTGVAAVTNGTADAGTDNAHIKAYTYVVGSTGDLTVAADETGSADEEKGLAVYVLSGADTTTPIDIAANATGTTTTDQVAPSVDPTSDDAFLICHVNSGGGANSAPYTSPGSMTEQYDATVGGIGYVGATEQLTVDTATGTRTFTSTNGTAYAAVSIAVKTAGEPPAPTYAMLRPAVVAP